MKNPGKYHRLTLSILFSFLITAVISCSKNDLNPDVGVDTRLIEKLYLESKDTVVIDNQNLVLETDLYRDFFPGVPKKNTKLNASISVVNCDSSFITDRFEIKTLYVINMDQVWISDPKSQDDPYTPIFKVSGISINGPEWETGIFVYIDVVLAIQDLSTAKLNYLIARNQKIMRLD
jgi:hypothetical protein